MSLDSSDSDSEQRFWNDLDTIVGTPCENQAAIDHALKAFLSLTAAFGPTCLHTDYDWAKCAFKLLHCPLFRKHKGYVRRRMYGRLRKEQSASRLILVATFLLYDGREAQKVFEQMLEEGLFIRLVELLKERRETEPVVWRVCLELLYEMSRFQKVRPADLDAIDDDFVKYLFQLVEEDPEDIDNDPYHYGIIRMLLVLNEQYMVSAHASPGEVGPTNKIIKILCYHGAEYRTFGENIVLLINREAETSLQLLILKLLYLLFTTTATYEYFYSNDLRVLVDVIIRNLLDLPDEAQSLRHTYLRVLYPLLNHSQLRHPPYYKRDEILKLFEILSQTHNDHFAPADSTTVRLVDRCMSVSWLNYTAEDSCLKPENPAHRLLGMSLAAKGESSYSIAEIAVQSEKPGVMLPSKSRGEANAMPGTKVNGRTSANTGMEIAGEA